VRAGRNPLSVLYDISLCSLPELGVETYSSVWPCSLWDRFFIPTLVTSDFIIIVHPNSDFFYSVASHL